ncbi:MAG TPA: hypothetical protein VMD59_23985 [Acidimicrobiales bacterium]|nr:hypothetical protein [Acidimicrobiales bacterium]
MDKSLISPSRFGAHRALTRPRTKSEPQLSNTARTQLIRRGSVGNLPFGAGNRAVSEQIRKVTENVFTILKSEEHEDKGGGQSEGGGGLQGAQDRTDALFGMGPQSTDNLSHPGERGDVGGGSGTTTTTTTDEGPTSTIAKGWKQFKRRVRDLFGWGKRGDLRSGPRASAARREDLLTKKYGIQIGVGTKGSTDNDDSVMSHMMLDRLEKALDQLPKSHVSGNDSLTKIVGNQGEGAASVYDPGKLGIGMNRPMNMPGWLYAILTPYWKILRTQMDQGAMEGYENISREEDEELGLDHSSREVFGGVSYALTGENLLVNTVRHEVGHAVDQQIGWEAAESAKPMWGGWRRHPGAAGAEGVARAFLVDAGLDPDAMVHEPTGRTLLVFFAEAIDDEKTAHSSDPVKKLAGDGASPSFKTFRESGDNKAKVNKAVEWLRVALTHPWTFSDGGGERVTHGDRIYQRDYQDSWVSYEADKRQLGLSNYMFANPGEFFAEAYAAYYNPAENGPRSQLSGDMRVWFLEHLGAPKEVGQEGRNQGSGSLSTGRLGKIRRDGE